MTSTPLDRISEDELVERARQTMGRAASLPVGSLGRSIQWGVFDTLMAELGRRAIRYRLSRLERYGSPQHDTGREGPERSR